jgi:hypothetical protein
MIDHIKFYLPHYFIATLLVSLFAFALAPSDIKQQDAICSEYGGVHRYAIANHTFVQCVNGEYYNYLKYNWDKTHAE